MLDYVPDHDKYSSDEIVAILKSNTPAGQGWKQVATNAWLRSDDVIAGVDDKGLRPDLTLHIDEGKCCTYREQTCEVAAISSRVSHGCGHGSFARVPFQQRQAGHIQCLPPDRHRKTYSRTRVYD